jgi:hypothetical protein
MREEIYKDPQNPITTRPLINLLDVVYAHARTSDGGDIYLTYYGLLYADLLDLDNWYEKAWFESQRVQLSGTGSAFRVPTKEVDGRRLQLVVKNSRVGEDVPLTTHVLEEFINAEFNSPWEEFSLVMEMKANTFGPRHVKIRSQRPLAIYVPPERLQLWQTGRSRHRINKIVRRYPGISLDILRQYKLIYQWIEGIDVVEAFGEIGVAGDELAYHLETITRKVAADVETKGFVVADMKPSHVIIGEKEVKQMRELGDRGENGRAKQSRFLLSLIKQGRYSVVDYELMRRSPAHEEQVKHRRRRSYLDDQRDRFQVAPLPPFLKQSEIMGVPYVHGHAESTGGLLWVVGRNPRLFDYFLPERWRRTACRPLSERHEIYYTMTKDNIHIVWKISRVGEAPPPEEGGAYAALMAEHGFNSPFEEFAIAHFLSNNGVPTVYVRAIYMTGSHKTEPVTDPRRFESHRNLQGMDGLPILREDHNYISIRGFFNGPDAWVAAHEGRFYQAFDLQRAAREGILSDEECLKLLDVTRARLRNVGYDGTLMEMNDLLVALDPDGKMVLDGEGLPEARICNFELLHKT